MRASDIQRFSISRKENDVRASTHLLRNELFTVERKGVSLPEWGTPTRMQTV